MKINTLENAILREQFQRCCGSSKWVNGMLEGIPFSSKEAVFELAEKIWTKDCGKADFLEAASHHPKIGDIKSLEKKFATTANWSSNEQQGVNTAKREVIEALAQGNADYEAKFAYIFIVCATGKTAAEMLALLQARLHNDPAHELVIAMGEQHKITLLRLEKMFTEIENLVTSEK